MRPLCSTLLAGRQECGILIVTEVGWIQGNKAITDDLARWVDGVGPEVDFPQHAKIRHDAVPPKEGVVVDNIARVATDFGITHDLTRVIDAAGRAELPPEGAEILMTPFCQRKA